MNKRDIEMTDNWMEQSKSVFLDPASEEFKEMVNVAEPWMLYDTILVCNTFYGNELNINTWFNTFQQFAQNETHRFFKSRTRGTAGLQYNNQNNADTMDFAFVAFTMGLSFFGCPIGAMGEATPQDGVAGDILYSDPYAYPFWTMDLPNQSAIQLKIQQDIVAEMVSAQCMPGYGAAGGAGGATDTAAIPNAVSPPFMNYNINQGEPNLQNRWRFPSPLGIPRTATIEGILHLSNISRESLGEVTGPANMAFNTETGSPPFNFFPARFGIQMSLGGVRLVQQRGQYHR